MLYGDINAEILRRAAAAPRGGDINAEILRRATASTAPMANRSIPASGIGDAVLRLPVGRGTISRTAVSRAGVVPSTTLAPASVFGGINGGMGANAGAAPTALGPSMLTNFSSSVGKAGTGIMNTLGSLIPLAIKVVLAVIVIKIVLWLVKGRRR
jgi:hypothetical protein